MAGPLVRLPTNDYFHPTGEDGGNNAPPRGLGGQAAGHPRRDAEPYRHTSVHCRGRSPCENLHESHAAVPPRSTKEGQRIAFVGVQEGPRVLSGIAATV